MHGNCVCVLLTYSCLPSYQNGGTRARQQRMAQKEEEHAEAAAGGRERHDRIDRHEGSPYLHSYRMHSVCMIRWCL